MERSKLLEDKFMTTARFSQEVERIVLNNKDMNYIDAIIHYCEVNVKQKRTVFPHKQQVEELSITPLLRTTLIMT